MASYSSPTVRFLVTLHTLTTRMVPSPRLAPPPPATAVESLLITAAELHIRADLGVVDAAEKTLTTNPAAPVSEQSTLACRRRAQRASMPPFCSHCHLLAVIIRREPEYDSWYGHCTMTDRAGPELAER